MSEDQKVALAQDLLDRLIDVGAHLPDEFDETELINDIESGADSERFVALMCDLAHRLFDLRGTLSEKQNPIELTNAPSFAQSLVSFLNAEDYPHAVPLSFGTQSDFFSKFRPLDFLTSEVQILQITLIDNPPTAPTESMAEDDSAAPSKVAPILYLMRATLQIPDEQLTLVEVITTINKKVQEIAHSVPSDYLGKPVVSRQLKPQQVELLEAINQDLDAEYKLRRKVLQTRFDTTVKTFYYSPKIKGMEPEIDKAVESLKLVIRAVNPISLSDLFSPNDDLLIVRKVSSTKARNTSVSVLRKMIVVPKVPDRGGRVGPSSGGSMPEFRPRSGDSGKGRGSGQGDAQASNRVQSASNKGSGRSGNQGGGWKKSR